MKTLYPFSLLFALILCYSNSQAQKDSTHFVTTWATTVQSFLNDSVIAISTDPNYNYNFDVDWNNDGVFDTLGVKGCLASVCFFRYSNDTNPGKIP